MMRCLAWRMAGSRGKHHEAFQRWACRIHGPQGEWGSHHGNQAEDFPQKCEQKFSICMVLPTWWILPPQTPSLDYFLPSTSPLLEKPGSICPYASEIHATECNPTLGRQIFPIKAARGFVQLDRHQRGDPRWKVFSLDTAGLRWDVGGGDQEMPHGFGVRELWIYQRSLRKGRASRTGESPLGDEVAERRRFDHSFGLVAPGSEFGHNACHGLEPQMGRRHYVTVTWLSRDTAAPIAWAQTCSTMLDKIWIDLDRLDRTDRIHFVFFQFSFFWLDPHLWHCIKMYQVYRIRVGAWSCLEVTLSRHPLTSRKLGIFWDAL